MRISFPPKELDEWKAWREEVATSKDYDPRQALRGWKGAMTERLVRLYMNDVLIPNLKKKFDSVFIHLPDEADFVEGSIWTLPLSVFDATLLLRGEKVDWEELWEEAGKPKVIIDGSEASEEDSKEFWKRESITNATIIIPRDILQFFLSRRFFPSSDFYDKTIKLVSLLAVRPDGILFKLNKRDESFDKVFESFFKKLPNFVDYIYENLEVPESPISVVEGDIEVIEIKADKAFIRPHQKETYKEVVENGFLFRYFHVDIISLEDNQFEIWEKTIRTTEELENLMTTVYKKQEKRTLQK